MSTLGQKWWFIKTGKLLKEVQFIWRFLWHDKRMVTFNIGDCLIEVTAW